VIEAVARFWREDQGQDLVEYALLAVLVAAALVVAIGLLTGGVSSALSEGTSAL
jgi:Flp pilus assembly pilin Flp